MFTNLLRVKLILWDGQLSINSKNITVSKHLIEKNQYSSFLIKCQKIAESNILSVARRYHKPFEIIVSIIYMLQINEEFVISFLSLFMLQE